MGKPGPKPTLSREDYIDAALEEIDARGVAGLNMRGLSARLGVSAMTPYTHFADKTELLDAAVERALAVFEPPPPSEGTWQERLAEAMRAMYEELVEHPGVIDLILQRSEAAAHAVSRQHLLEMLEAAGLEPGEAFVVLRTASSYVFGYAALTRLPGASGRDTFEAGLRAVLAY
jgi:AcrR family transcriptional regulator